MNFRTPTTKAVLLIIFLGTSSASQSQNEAVLVPYVEAGVVDYSLSFKGDVPLPGGGHSIDKANNKFYFDYMSVKVGLAASYGDFSANLYYSTTNKDTDDQPLPPGLPASSIRWEGDRSAYSGTIGYSVTDSVSVFGGYRNSEAEGSGSSNSDYTFKHDGYFVGGGYKIDLTASGAMTFGVGYAWLDAELDENFFGLQFPFDNGDGSGFKLGVQPGIPSCKGHCTRGGEVDLISPSNKVTIVLERVI